MFIHPLRMAGKSNRRSGNEEAAVRQSDPDRARAVLASHRMITQLMGLDGGR